MILNKKNKNNNQGVFLELLVAAKKIYEHKSRDVSLKRCF